MSWIKTFQGFATVGMLSAMLVIGSWVRSIDDHAKEAPTQTDIAEFKQIMKALNEKVENLPSKSEWTEVKVLVKATTDDLKDNWNYTIKNTEDINSNKEWFASMQGYIMGRFENLRDSILTDKNATD